MVWHVILYGGGHTWWAAGTAALAASSCMVWWGGGGMFRARAMHLSGYHQIWVCVESRVPALRRMAARSRQTLERHIHYSGHTMDTERAATISTRLALTLAAPCVALAYVGATHHYTWAAAAAAPCIAYAAPHIQIWLWTRRRAICCSREAAFFLAYVHIVQTAGGGLYRAFEMLERAAAFPAMGREARIIRRRAAAGDSRNGALLHYSRHHPVPILRDFVAGYVAKQSAVGDVPSYTAEKARQAFAIYEAAWSRYERSAQEIFGGIMMFAIILPMMIMLSAMLGTPQTVHTLLSAGTLISPIVSLAMVLALGGAQPPAGASPPVWRLSPVPGCCAGIMLHMMGAEPAVSMSAAALAFAASNSIMTAPALRAMVSCERMLPEFLRDMTEMSRTGASVPRMIRRQAARAPYEAPFNGMMRGAAGRMARGMTLAESLVGFPAPGARFVMFIISVIHRTGGGTPALLDMVSEFAGRVLHAKESVTKSLAPLCCIVYATPFITLGMAHVMLGIFAGSAAASAPDTGLPFSPISGDAADSYTKGMGMMAASMSIPMGMVAAKISAHTIRDTRPLCVVSASSLAALTLLPHIMEWIGVG